jgi:hypothetical protein
VSFRDSGPSEGEIEGRLDALFECFAQTLESLARRTPSRGRPAIPDALVDELRDLRSRAGGVDAFVIDGETPVIWCSVSAGSAVDVDGKPRTSDAQVAAFRLRGLRLVRGRRASLSLSLSDAPDVAPRTRRAVSLLRDLPERKELPQGGNLRHLVREADFGMVARDVGDIYITGVVFDSPFDELGAERALAHALPRIERLLAALPPLDPTPDRPSNVIPLRRRQT